MPWGLRGHLYFGTLFSVPFNRPIEVETAKSQILIPKNTRIIYIYMYHDISI
jgi:hypothetical protein